MLRARFGRIDFNCAQSHPLHVVPTKNSILTVTIEIMEFA